MMKFNVRLMVLLAAVMMLAISCRAQVQGEKEIPQDTVKEVIRRIEGTELLENVDARKAISLAIDKEYIVSVILANGSVAADYFVPKQFVYDDGVDFRNRYPDGWLAYNPDLAVEHWERAKEALGFTQADITFLTYDSESSKLLSEHIKRNLEETLEGLEVKLHRTPFKAKLPSPSEIPYHMELAGWGPDYPDAMTFLDLWVSGVTQNRSGYSDTIYDETIKRAKTGDLAGDPVGRILALQELERKLIEEDAVIVPLYQRGGFELVKPNVSGIRSHAFGGDFTYKETRIVSDDDGERYLRLVTDNDLPGLDTNKATSSVSFEVLVNTVEGLFSHGENDGLDYGMARSYAKSEDGLSYVFYLRENAVWSNGEPVTAHDFVYSWRRLADPKTESQYSFMVETAGLKNYEAVMSGMMSTDELGVVALDDYTLKVMLEHPIPYFEKLMTFANFYPVNQAFVESVGESFGTSVETTLYNGPFVLETWEPEKGYSFVKNETYWDKDDVLLDGVSYRIVEDTQAGVNLYEKGEIDRIKLSGEVVETYRNHPDLKHTFGTGVYYLILVQGYVESRY